MKQKIEIGNRNIIANVYRVQAYNSIRCRYFCIGSIGFELKVKSLLGYTNLFPPSNYERNDKTILKCFQQNLNKLKCIVMFVINIENLKTLKYIFLNKR